MNNKKVQLIVMNAMIGAAYAVLTILISPIAYGAVQMRLTEIIVLLAQQEIYSRTYYWMFACKPCISNGII